jgi:hypothetical protein
LAYTEVGGSTQGRETAKTGGDKEGFLEQIMLELIFEGEHEQSL